MVKKILILTGAGLLSFGVFFVVAWFTHPAEVVGEQDSGQMQVKTDALDILEVKTIDHSDERVRRMRASMTEKRLKELVYEVRWKIQEYEAKLANVDLQEQRMQTAHETLAMDIEKLNNLRMQIDASISTLKSERDKLEKSRIAITEVEKENLQAIAATYNKMDAESASKILVSMTKNKDIDGNDAIKILHYMAERSKAKLLAALATSEPKLAAYFCSRLKEVTEGI